MENGNGFCRESELKPMDAEQLREYGHKMVDFIADYYKNIEDFPVVSQVQPGYLRNLLPESAPVCPDSLGDIFNDVRAKILPGCSCRCSFWLLAIKLLEVLERMHLGSLLSILLIKLIRLFKRLARLQGFTLRIVEY